VREGLPPIRSSHGSATCPSAPSSPSSPSLPSSLTLRLRPSIQPPSYTDSINSKSKTRLGHATCAVSDPVCGQSQPISTYAPSLRPVFKLHLNFSKTPFSPVQLSENTRIPLYDIRSLIPDSTLTFSTSCAQLAQLALLRPLSSGLRATHKSTITPPT
jgi:hypothetical protein